MNYHWIRQMSNTIGLNELLNSANNYLSDTNNFLKHFGRNVTMNSFFENPIYDLLSQYPDRTFYMTVTARKINGIQYARGHIYTSEAFNRVKPNKPPNSEFSVENNLRKMPGYNNLIIIEHPVVVNMIELKNEEYEELAEYDLMFYH